MKYSWAIILILLCAACLITLCEASDKKQVTIEARVLETTDNYSKRYGNLSTWTVKEETDTVQRALDVYKKKSQPLYHKKVWIVDKRDDKRNFFLDYTCSRDKLVFAPGEDYVFWVGQSWLGKPTVYGKDLFGGRTFTIAGADNFDLLTCRNKKTYVVIQTEKPGTDYYYVYDLSGQKKKSFTRGMDICSNIDF